MNPNELLRPTVIVLLAVVLLAAGCGRKTLPIPPQDLVAVAITDLASTRDDSGITLTWTAPQRTLQGRRLARVDSYEITRAQVPDSRYCPECPAVFSPLATTAGGPVTADGNRVRLRHRDTNLAPGNYYLYKVRTRSGWYAVSDYSNRTAQLWGQSTENAPDAETSPAQSTQPNQEPRETP